MNVIDGQAGLIVYASLIFYSLTINNILNIIVLLILAGVAISMLAGENGIITKTNSAKTENEKATVEEQVKLAVLAALAAGNGELEGENAFKALNNGLKEAGYTGDDIEESDLPATIKINGNDYIIEANGTTREPSELEKLKGGEPVKQNTTLTADDNLTITIPENFKLSASSPTKVTEGMIIEDSQDNQYVWIPVVEKSETYTWGVDYSALSTLTEGTAEYYTAIESALKTYTTNYKDSSCTDVWYGNANYGQYGYFAKDDTAQEKLIYYTNGNMSKDEYNTIYHNMLTSVYKNKGFYIGRYEMGIAEVKTATEANSIRRNILSEYKSSEDNTTNEAPTIEGMAIPVSKANAVGYTYITQSQAQMLAEELGKGTDYSKVTSSIMFGVQWDAVCVFIENFDKNNTAATKKEWLTKNDYSKLWGNYQTSEYALDRGFYSTNYGSTYLDKITTPKAIDTKWLYTTGAVEKNSSLNIYDFAGNLGEWTLERLDDASDACIMRGGFYSGYSNYASSRSFVYTAYSESDISSRATLYIK